MLVDIVGMAGLRADIASIETLLKKKTDIIRKDQ